VENDHYLKSNLQKKELEVSSAELSQFIIDCILDKKGKEIVRLDLTNLPEAVFDHFIICEGNSTTQLKAIADYISVETKNQLGEYTVNGGSFGGNQEWILLDFFSVVVHVFLKDKRDFYRLEELWSDGVTYRYGEDGSIIK